MEGVFGVGVAGCVLAQPISFTSIAMSLGPLLCRSGLCCFRGLILGFPYLQQPDMHAAAIPFREVPVALSKQTGILLLKASQTVSAFGHGNIFGHLEHNKKLGCQRGYDRG